MYVHRPNIGPQLRRRQQGLDDDIKSIAWKAQHRLHSRYWRLASRGKSKQLTVTAVSVRGELLGFIWAIGVHVERQYATPKTKALLAA